MMMRVGFRISATFPAVFLVVFTASAAVEIYAQSWGYDRNRIAISADGNSAPDDGHHWKTGDPDDLGGHACRVGDSRQIEDARQQRRLDHFS